MASHLPALLRRGAPDRRGGARGGVAALGALVLLATPALGQPDRGGGPPRPVGVRTSTPPAGRAAPTASATLQGMVLDGGTDRPLEGVVVVVEAVREAGGEGGRSAALARPAIERLAARRSLPVGDPAPAGVTRTVLSGPRGEYRAVDLPAGRYVLRLRALGYRPAAVTVDLGDVEARQLSVGLEVAAVRLHAVAVTGTGGDAFGHDAWVAARADERLRAEALRRARHLDSDARVLTARDVREAITVAEPDLLRTLQRLPGVSARDEYTAALWTRGASWDQTAVTFDGVPLFNPVHAAGLVGVVDGAALGLVAFHPGVQPTELASGGSALLRLESRSGAGSTRARGGAELSLLGARAHVARELAGARAAVRVAARRSHLDLAPLGLRALGAPAARTLPYAFGDVVARADVDVGGGRTLEVSALGAWDRLWDDVPGIVRGTRGRWTNGAARVTLTSAHGRARARHSVGASRFRSRMALADSAASPLPDFVAHPCGCLEPVAGVYVGQPTDHQIALAFVDGAWTWGEAPRGAPPRTRAGYRVSAQSARIATAGAWPHATRPGGAVRAESPLTVAVAWAERHVRAGRVEAQLGVRAEGGSAVSGAGRLRTAPRASARAALTSRTSLTAGAARTYQYAHGVAPVGRGRNAIASSGALWMSAGPAMPVLRADLATAGLDHALGATDVATATVYARSTTGVAVPDPAPGVVTGRALVVAAAQEAQGVELSLRRLAGPWTGALSYTLARSQLDVAGRRYAAPWARERILQATAAVRLGGGFRLAGAYGAASGAPYTRYVPGSAHCAADGRCQWSVPPSVGVPSGARTAAHRRADVALDWQRVRAAGEGGDPGQPARGWGASVQIHNLLGQPNPAAYLESQGACVERPTAARPCEPQRGIWQRTTDDALAGLPTTVSAGVRLSF